MASEKFKNVVVNLVGTSDNAFSIMGLTMRALRKAGATEQEVKQYKEEATAGDYDELLRVTCEWVDVQ